jgi:hypothetical protein
MHKAVILLIKAENKGNAIEKAHSFMEPYGEGKVWDWYAIGGRWSGTLAPMHKEFIEKSKLILEEKKGGFISQQEIDSKQDELQKVWLELKGVGPNPYSDHYKLPDEGGFYDVLALEDCLKVVKEWRQDSVIEGLKEMEESKRWLKPKNERDDYHMYGYSLKRAAVIFSEEFSFECSVFNTENYDFSIPENPKGYFAIMIDMHN